jgi:hypothetical protein
MQELINYHCSSEWHLSKLKNRYSGLIYSFGLRISKTSKNFFCSAVNLAEYFDCHRNTIYNALTELRTIELFSLLSKKCFEVSVYRVLSHKEWAAIHPGQCPDKLEFPWSQENDQLGQQIYAASGGKIKVSPFQITALRKTSLSDDLILARFKYFFGQDIGHPSGVIPRFVKFVKADSAGASTSVIQAA